MTYLDRLYQNQFNRTRDMVQSPDWYVELTRFQRMRLVGQAALRAALDGEVRDAKKIARQVEVSIFETLLDQKEVYIGDPEREDLVDEDDEREPIRQIVLHHSGRAEGITNRELNVLHLLRLYVPAYQAEYGQKWPDQRQPIHSSHVDETGEQVFYGYHWKVAQDGSTERLLADSAMAWHAGNLAVNRRSIAICIDDNLTNHNPTGEALEAVGDIIRSHYQEVLGDPDAIVGHREVSSSPTICPGNTFLVDWKKDVIECVSS